MSRDTPEKTLRRTQAMLAAGPNATAHALLLKATAAHPDHAALACRLADSFHLRGELDHAEATYRRALACDPDRFDAWYGLGAIHLAVQRYGQAVQTLREALARNPDAAAARGNLADALYNLGEVEPAIAEYRRVAAGADPVLAEGARANIACIIPGSPGADNAAILAARRDWATRATAGIKPRPRPPRPPGDKPRIGYVSSFFGAANWMKPVFGAINHHDRDRFEIHLISTGPEPTAQAGYRARDEDRIWLVAGLDVATLAGHIADAGIDILVDLNGYSAQPLLGLFAYRPAPRQIGWFNMYATTGMDVFDALIGDDAVIPPEEEAHYIEHIERVPGSYLAFSVLYDVPSVAPPPCLARDRITFGCFGSAYKLTGENIAAWSRILRAAPNTDLFLKNSTLDDPSNRDHLLARFAANGIDASRLRLGGRADHYEFLAAYGEIDIALDTFPYNGGTTTTEALWQGVPVLAFNGDRWAARTSRTLLRAADLADWVAADAAAYVARAIALANDPATPEMLAELRASMRTRLRASPVCDSENLCRALEAIYARACA